MPNTPVIVRNGTTIYASGTAVDKEDKATLDHMLTSVGVGMEMQEHYMDIITGLTGCGPSYVSVNQVDFHKFMCKTAHTTHNFHCTSVLLAAYIQHPKTQV